MPNRARSSTWPWIAAALLPAALTAAGAQAQLPSNSLPAFIADERTLIGKYRYEEAHDGMKVAVDLNADHSAAYRITTGADDAAFMEATGVWTLQDDVIHIHNTPGPVRLDAEGPPARDPGVALSVTVRNADGSPAEGLGVTWPDAQGLFVMTGGRHQTRREEPIAASQAYVLRLADRKVLGTIDLRAGGPNSFRFRYRPSDVEPFDIPAIALDARAAVIEVEVGTAQAKLRRVAR